MSLGTGGPYQTRDKQLTLKKEVEETTEHFLVFHLQYHFLAKQSKLELSQGVLNTEVTLHMIHTSRRVASSIERSHCIRIHVH